MNHRKPADSPDHQRLRQLAQEAGQEAIASGRLLWGLNAPAKLTAFIQVARNLRESLRLIHQHRYADLAAIGLAAWPEALQWVESQGLNLIQEVGPHLNKQPKQGSTKASHPLRGGGMVRHSLYTSLWNTHADDGWQASYRLLQGHLVLTQIELLRVRNIIPAAYDDYAAKAPILGSFNSSVDEACRRLRDLSLHGHTKHLERFLVEAAHGDFVQQTCSQYRDPEQADKSPFVQKIALFVYLAYVTKKTRNSRSRGAMRKRVGQLLHDGNLDWAGQMLTTVEIGDPADMDADWGDQTIIRDQIPNSHLDDADLDPDENSRPDEVYISGFGCKDRSGSPVTQRLAALGQVRHTVMGNQLLRHRWTQMTLWEVSQLVKLCGGALKKPLDYTSKPNDSLLIEECAALLLTMLWTGSPLGRARALDILEPGATSTASLAYDPVAQAWLVTPRLPKYQTEPQAAAIEASRTRVSHMRITDYFKVGAFLVKRRTKTGWTGRSAFQHTHEEHERGIKNLLARLPAGHRVTLSKVERFLFYLIAAEGAGDIADAALITGQYHHLAQTLLHYTTPEVQDLQRTYRKAVEGILADIFKEAYDKDPPDLAETTDKPGAYLGSRLCPKTERVKEMVEECRRLLYGSNPEYSLWEWATYHNRYTVYTSQYVGYATGYRAITDPSFTEERIDPLAGLGVISDKDGEDDYYNTRLVWLPEGVREQLRHYQAHRQHMIAALELHAPDRVPKEFFFLLHLRDNGMSLIVDSVRPKSMSRFLKNLLPLPLNANRRFLRTELKRHGCPVEIINCFMGHWQRGEEPWGMYSTFSMADYVRHLAPAVESILDEVGWKPLRSRFA